MDINLWVAKVANSNIENLRCLCGIKDSDSPDMSQV